MKCYLFSFTCFLCLHVIGVPSLYAENQTEDSVPSKQSTNSAVDIELQKTIWKKWVKKYTAGTPYAAHNKLNNLTQFTPYVVNFILQGGEEIDFEYDSGKINTINLNESSRTRKEFLEGIRDQSHLEFGTIRDRFEINLAFLSFLIRNNPSDNLLIINVGAKHVSDFFFQFPQESIYYTGKITNENSIYFTPEFYSFIAALAKDLHNRFPNMGDEVDNLLSYYLLNFGMHLKFRNTKTKPITPTRAAQDVSELFENQLDILYDDVQCGLNEFTADDILKKSPTQSNIIIIRDHHLINDLSSIADLPDSKCLQTLGYQSVTFVYEGLVRRPMGHTIDSAFTTLNYAHRLAGQKIQLNMNPQTNLLDFAKQVSPKAYEILKTGKAQLTPGDIISLRKALQLKNSGMPVYVQGMEINSTGQSADVNQDFIKLLRKWYQLHDRRDKMGLSALRSGSANALWGSSEVEEELKNVEKQLSLFYFRNK